MRTTILGSISFSLLFAISAAADTIRVPADQPTIQAGIDAAANGDVVLVAPGTYTGPGNKDLDLRGKAITVRSEAGADVTTIDCEQSGRGFLLHLGETATTVIEGFTVLNSSVVFSGGGLYLASTSPTVRGCVIQGSYLSGPGGGVYATGGSPVFEECTFKGNTIAAGGGGIFLDHVTLAILEDCVITENQASIQAAGGGLYAQDSTVRLTRCSITLNTAMGGGGMAVLRSDMVVTDSVINDNTVQGNSPAAAGGGIRAIQSSLAVNRCTLASNRAISQGTPHGGAISSFLGGNASITDCLFDLNACGSGNGGALEIEGGSVTRCVFTGNVGKGGAIYVRGPGISITGCTLAGNGGSVGAAGIQLGSTGTAAIEATIVAHNLGPAIVCEASTEATFSCSDLFGNEGGDWIGCVMGQQGTNGNLATDPLFCGLESGDLHLNEASPCAPDNSGGCGLVGALPVGCGVTAIEPTTWGRIKARARSH